MVKEMRIGGNSQCKVVRSTCTYGYVLFIYGYV